MAKSLTIGDLIFKLGLGSEEEFVASLKKVMKEAEGTTEKAGGEAGRKGGRETARRFSEQFKATFSGAAIGSFLGTALAQAFSGAVAAATRFAVDSVREFAVYEQGLLQLKLAGETNLGALSKRIQDTAKATKVFSATDVSLAVGELVKAGYDAETAFKLVETGALGAASEVDAATGRFGDLGGTAKQLGNILRALGMDTSESGRVMDVLARAAQDSNLNVSDLVDIVSRVGPTAKLAGLEIEDLAAMAGVLANNGMEASLIGTGLRSVLQSLINPSGQVKSQLDALGISLVDSKGNLRDFNDVLDGLHELTQRGGEGLQLLTAATGSFGSAAAANLGSASEEVKRFRENMGNAAGTAQGLADTMRDSAAGAAAELHARLADARAELGEQLMPILLQLHETVLPALVTALGLFADGWEAAEMMIRGTTRALEDMKSEGAKIADTAFGEGAGELYTQLLELDQQINDLQKRIDRLSPEADMWGIQRRGLQRQLEDLKTQREVVQAQYDAMVAARRAASRVAAWDSGELPFGPLPEGQARETAAAIAEVVEAYRNLERIEAELAEARSKWAAAGSAEEEARWAAEVQRLEAEKRAKEAAVKTAEAAAGTITTVKDPLVDEAQRVQNDLQRLKLAYEQGKLSSEDYVNAMEAHMRRLDGLYERATSPQQSLAILRARQAFLDEQARLLKESARKLKVEPFARIDTDEVERQQRMAEARVRNNQRMIDELVAQEKALDDWREQHARERAAQQQAFVDELNAIEAAQLEAAVKADVEARQRAARESEARQKAIADARARNNQRMLDELMAQEAAYHDWLASEEAKREAAAQTRRDAQAAARVRNNQRVVDELMSIEGAYYAWLADQAAAPARRQAETAAGALVRLAQAQRTLGLATRDDVQAALEEQIALLNELIPTVEAGSDQYYEWVAALEAARAALKRLNDEVPDIKMPVLGSPEAIRAALRETEAAITQIQAQIAEGPDSVTLALLEQRLAFFQTLLQQLQVASADLTRAQDDQETWEAAQGEARALADNIMDVATSFPKAIVDGIRSGDIEGALTRALGSAADFFLDRMLKAILGPITEQLTKSIASSMASQAAGGAGGAAGLGALGPAAWILGGLALVASLALGGSQRKQAAERDTTAVKAAVSGAPSVTYNLSATVNVAPGASFGDPAWEAKMRTFVQRVAEDLQARVPRKG